MEIYGKFIGIHGNRKKMMAINLWHHKWGKKRELGWLNPPNLLDMDGNWIVGIDGPQSMAIAMEFIWIYGTLGSLGSTNGDVDFRQHEFRSFSERESVGFSTSMWVYPRILPGYWWQCVQSMTGWWLTYPSEKCEFVSWDDDIPNTWENKSHVPVTTNQMRMEVMKLWYPAW